MENAFFLPAKGAFAARAQTGSAFLSMEAALLTRLLNSRPPARTHIDIMQLGSFRSCANKTIQRERVERRGELRWKIGFFRFYSLQIQQSLPADEFAWLLFECWVLGKIGLACIKSEVRFSGLCSTSF
jgi:hypothetical protein